MCSKANPMLKNKNESQNANNERRTYVGRNMESRRNFIIKSSAVVASGMFGASFAHALTNSPENPNRHKNSWIKGHRL